jgi:hypothetical protein
MNALARSTISPSAGARSSADGHICAIAEKTARFGLPSPIIDRDDAFLAIRVLVLTALAALLCRARPPGSP